MTFNTMTKFAFVIVALIEVFVSTSLAVNGQADQQNRWVAEGVDLHEAELESWLRQRGQAEPYDALAVDNQLARARELSEANQKKTTLIPEASNYDDVAEPQCLACCAWWSCRRRRRSVVRTTGNARNKLSEIVIFGSATELKLYSDQADRDTLFSSPVARAELVTRPLDPDTPAQVSDALGGLQHAVVATLTDGRQFLVVKGNQKGQGTQTVVILADHMADDWTKVTSKDVSQSTLGDFIKAGGDRFDPLKDNGTHAARRMMALP